MPEYLPGSYNLWESPATSPQSEPIGWLEQSSWFLLWLQNIPQQKKKKKSENFEEQDLFLIAPNMETLWGLRDGEEWGPGALPLLRSKGRVLTLFFSLMYVCQLSMHLFNIFKSLYWICYHIASVIYVLIFWLWGLWDLISLTKGPTLIPCFGRQSLNHWTAREVPSLTHSLSANSKHRRDN